MTFVLDTETIKTDKDVYEYLKKNIYHFIIKEDNYLSSLSNFTAIIKELFTKVSWAGFYLYDGKKLYLGPFQGKIACTYIELGKGVCGTAAKELKTIIVTDVNKFDGHIACDSSSKSEIVVPLLRDDELFGVLDLDSTEYNSFNELDKEYLEYLCNYLTKTIS